MSKCQNVRMFGVMKKEGEATHLGVLSRARLTGLHARETDGPGDSQSSLVIMERFLRNIECTLCCGIMDVGHMAGYLDR